MTHNYTLTNQGDVCILAAACHFLDRKSTNGILFAAAAMNLFCREEASGDDAVLSIARMKAGVAIDALQFLSKFSIGKCR